MVANVSFSCQQVWAAPLRLGVLFFLISSNKTFKSYSWWQQQLAIVMVHSLYLSSHTYIHTVTSLKGVTTAAVDSFPCSVPPHTLNPSATNYIPHPLIHWSMLLVVPPIIISLTFALTLHKIILIHCCISKLSQNTTLYSCSHSTIHSLSSHPQEAPKAFVDLMLTFFLSN